VHVTGVKSLRLSCPLPPHLLIKLMQRGLQASHLPRCLPHHTQRLVGRPAEQQGQGCGGPATIINTTQSNCNGILHWLTACLPVPHAPAHRAVSAHADTAAPDSHFAKGFPLLCFVKLPSKPRTLRIRPLQAVVAASPCHRRARRPRAASAASVSSRCARPIAVSRLATRRSCSHLPLLLQLLLPVLLKVIYGSEQTLAVPQRPNPNLCL
jgi:hypothetical protein